MVLANDALVASGSPSGESDEVMAPLAPEPAGVASWLSVEGKGSLTDLGMPAELDVSGSPTAGEPAEVEMPAASEPPSAPEPSGESVIAFSVGWGVSESEG